MSIPLSKVLSREILQFLKISCYPLVFSNIEVRAATVNYHDEEAQRLRLCMSQGGTGRHPRCGVLRDERSLAVKPQEIIEGSSQAFKNEEEEPALVLGAGSIRSVVWSGVLC